MNFIADFFLALTDVYNNHKTVPGEYPMSHCLNQLDRYGAVRKSIIWTNLVGALVKNEANF